MPTVRFYAECGLGLAKEAASAETGGIISPNGTVQVNEGADQKFTVTADAGMQVNQTLVDGTPATLQPDNTYTFTNVVIDHTISITFKPITSPNPLNLTKVDDVPPGHIVLAGEFFTYTIAYQNPFSFDVTGIKLVDQLPVPLVF